MNAIQLDYKDMLNILSALTYTYLYVHLEKTDLDEIKALLDKIQQCIKITSSNIYLLKEILP